MRKSLLVMPTLAVWTLLCAARTARAGVQVLSSDPRLSAKITIEDGGKSLKVLFGSLTADNRPKLLLRRDIEWERVSVFANERPLHLVLSDLGMLLNYSWRAGKTEPPEEYEIAPTASSLAFERNLLRETLSRGAEPLTRLVPYLRISPDEAKERYSAALKGKPIDDPVLDSNIFYIGREGSRTAIAAFGALTPDQRWTILSDGRVILSPSTMTADERTIVRNIGVESARLLERIGKQEEGVSADSAGEWAEKLGLQLYANRDALGGRVLSYGYSTEGSLGRWGGGDFRQVPSRPDVLPVRGNPYVKHVPGEKRPETDFDSVPFPANFKLTSHDTATWPDVLKELHRHLKQSLVSDDYQVHSRAIDRRGTPLPDLRRLTLSQGLDAVCRHFRRLWWRQDDTIFFRSRTWFIERQYEPPQPVIEEIRGSLEKTGLMDASALVAVSTLDPWQLDGLMWMMTVASLNSSGLDQDDWLEAHPRWVECSLLRLFVKLNDPQKRKVMGADGLPLAEMSEAHKNELLSILALERGSWALRRYPDLRLQIIQNQSVSPVDVNTRRVALSFRCWGTGPAYRLEDKAGTLRFASRPRKKDE